MEMWTPTFKGHERIVKTKKNEKVLIETSFLDTPETAGFPYGAFDIFVYHIDPKTHKVINKAPLDSFYTNSKSILDRQLNIYVNFWKNLNSSIKKMTFERRERERLQKCYRYRR